MTSTAGHARPANREMDLNKVDKWASTKLAALFTQSRRLGSQSLGRSLDLLPGRARVGFVDELAQGHWQAGAEFGAGHKKRAGVIATAITPAHPKMAATYSPTFAVPSAQLGLTSLFGMGRGGTPTL